MTTTDTTEGTINDTVSYHYDVFADVLYLRLVSDMETDSLGKPTDAGDIELHAEADGRLIGLTVISWWKRAGHGSLPDSLREVCARIGPWAGRISA